MLSRSLLMALGGLVSLSSLAVYSVKVSEASVDAGCVKCKSVERWDGSYIDVCQEDTGKNWGPRVCEFNNGSCSASGYATCSG